MSLPDLNTDEGRAAYRKELRQVGRPLRLTGLVLIVAAAALILAVRQGVMGLNNDANVIAYAMLAGGWVLLIAAIYMRTRYNRRRLMEGL